MTTYTDTDRIDWVLDILSLGDDTQADRKTLAVAIALAQGIVIGKTGRDVLDAAMEACK